MTLFALNYRERVALEELAVHTEDAKVCCRANALLWLDAGESAEEVAERLRVSRQTVYNWALRFQRRSTLRVSVLKAFRKYLEDATQVICVMKKLRAQAGLA